MIIQKLYYYKTYDTSHAINDFKNEHKGIDILASETRVDNNTYLTYTELIFTCRFKPESDLLSFAEFESNMRHNQFTIEFEEILHNIRKYRLSSRISEYTINELTDTFNLNNKR